MCPRRHPSYGGGRKSLTNSRGFLTAACFLGSEPAKFRFQLLHNAVCIGNEVVPRKQKSNSHAQLRWVSEPARKNVQRELPVRFPIGGKEALAQTSSNLKCRARPTAGTALLSAASAVPIAEASDGPGPKTPKENKAK